MDFNEELYDKIQAYLDKDLNSEEIREFERAMAADEALAREVQLHAEMQEFFADTPENNLRKNLEKLGAESIEDTPGFDWRLLALIPIVFAIIGFLMLGSSKETATVVGKSGEERKTNVTTTSNQDVKLSKNNVPENVTDSTEIKEEKITVPESNKKKEKKVSPPPPIIEIKSPEKLKRSPDTKDTELHELMPFRPDPPKLDTTTHAYVGVPTNDPESTPTSNDSIKIEQNDEKEPDFVPIQGPSVIADSPPRPFDNIPLEEEEPIVRVLSSPPANNEFPFEPYPELEALLAVDYSSQEEFGLTIRHKIPDTVRIAVDSANVSTLSSAYLREIGLYFAADLETDLTLNSDRFVMSTYENLGNTWGLDLEVLEPLGPNLYRMDARPIYPAALGLYYYEVYDEVNKLTIYAGKYVVVSDTEQKTPAEIYIAFNENPSLEFLIANNTTRSSDLEFSIEAKSDSFNIQTSSEIITFQFIGDITAKEDLSTKNLRLHLFSNNEERFNRFSMLRTSDLILEKGEENTFKFNFKADYKLSPGLYYFLVEDAETEDIYYTNKFVVKAKN